MNSIFLQEQSKPVNIPLEE